MEPEQKNVPEVSKEETKVSENKNKEMPKKEMSDKTKKIMCRPWLIIILAVVVVIFLAAAVGCVARIGRKSFGRNRNMYGISRNYMRRGNGKRYTLNQNGQNLIEAKVTAVNGQTFTVDNNGQPKNVQILDTTRFPLNSATKVNVGDTVAVYGQQDSNGVIQATLISVNP